MRRILVLLSLLVSLALSAAGTINVTPARPVTGLRRHIRYASLL